MANIALFLPVTDKILMGRIDSNYDKDTLASVIYDQQQLYIKKLIGTGLYNELSTQIIAGTLTALNTSLLDLVRDSLRHYVLADWQFESTSKNSNKGAQVMDGDNSRAADEKLLVQKVQRHLDKAQEYAQRVTDYLCENSSSYPLYSNPGSGADTIHPIKNNYRTGWYIGLSSTEEYDEYWNGLNRPSQ